MHATSPSHRILITCLAAVFLLLAASASAATFLEITPGKTTRSKIHELFGKPVSGKGIAHEAFYPRDKGLASLVVHYDSKSVVKEAEIILNRKFTTEQFELFFDFKGKAVRVRGNNMPGAKERQDAMVTEPFDSETVHYVDDGVHFFTIKNKVMDILLTVPGEFGGQIPSIGVLTNEGTQQTVAGEPPDPVLVKLLGIIQPGKTFGLELHDHLGKRYHPSAGVSGWTEGFRAEEKGLQDVVVWYTDQGIVKWARVRLVKAFAPAAARSLFKLKDHATFTDGHAFAKCDDALGRTEHYLADGVHFYVRGSVVREIWLTIPAADPAKIKAEAGAVYSEPKEGPEKESIGVKKPDRHDTKRPPGVPAPAVRILTAEYENNSGEKERPGLLVKIYMKTAGCREETVVVKVRLRQRDGSPIAAVRGAPPAYAENGRLCAAARDKVRFDYAKWEPFRVFIPYNMIALGPGRHELKILISAACGGATAEEEIPCTLQVP